MTSVYEILDYLGELARDKRDKGDLFERLFKTYLKTEPKYKELFEDVWLWNEWPDHLGPDSGIDLVAKERTTGDYWAIQCKFYSPNHTLAKSDIDSFFTASGKKNFSARLIVSTTNKWSKQAEAALEDQHIPVQRLGLSDLANSAIDWDRFNPNNPTHLPLRDKKDLYPHQRLALEKTLSGFETNDRGKLIMACGTGKTFTSLKIAENQVGLGGRVLFLVPSISLLSQSLSEWTDQAQIPLSSFAVCSDISIGRKNLEEDMRSYELGYPATTDVEKLIRQLESGGHKDKLTVIFSTYQSIEVIHQAQKAGLGGFDLIICDEAHRSTGTAQQGKESYFTKVHDQSFIRAKKRLYMTATPRLYTESATQKAKENQIQVWSMDDETIFGPEFYRLGFGEAVKQDLLSDYKVIILVVDKTKVGQALQIPINNPDDPLQLDDAVKIIGCWNGLSKKNLQTDDAQQPSPMRTAVGFTRSIKESQRIAELFEKTVTTYLSDDDVDESPLRCEVQHVDGTLSSLVRNERLDWLKDNTSQQDVCRILTNARCLSEGIDVPALDAVLFLNPKRSIVDVVQSVGRVMRKAPGKDYGYIILPIAVSSDVSAQIVLDNDKNYKVVWEVLQALRAHDERLDAEINKIDLNTKNDRIQVIGEREKYQIQDLSLDYGPLEDWREAIYGKIVEKCGTRRYWESWAKDVAEIANNHIIRIKVLLSSGDKQIRTSFDTFLSELHENLNSAITEQDAIEMLSQHLITKPVFDALFKDYSFTEHNPVSIAIGKVLQVLDGNALEAETESLEGFYESVRDRISGIDTAQGRQKIVLELYEKFFSGAFARTVERLGIVYTPVEVVDFILSSVNDALRQEFGLGLSDQGVHILDPFTGTGTFIVRLLQSGLIDHKDLFRKYSHELHANEIVLLAYYIAAINIESAFHEQMGDDYKPFEGIVLTDTFQMSESKAIGQGNMNEVLLPDNNERIKKQKEADIKVIVGNPPYSAKQKNENDNNQNLKYPKLDADIRETYARYSSATNKNGLYDSYIRSIRWASDRIGDKGVIGFVTNGSFLDNNAMDGLRKCLVGEFSSIYLFNLRGNQRTSGETSRREGGKIFGSGSRASIAITVLIKNPNSKGNCDLYYHDIGDYLTREQKLKLVSDFGSISNISWDKIVPDEHYDWINQRNPEFKRFFPIGKKKDASVQSLFQIYSRGIGTSRDAWAYNFSRADLIKNMRRMIDFYNSQVSDFIKVSAKTRDSKTVEIDSFVDPDPTKISWTGILKSSLRRKNQYSFDTNADVTSLYRPYCKQRLYFDSHFIHEMSQITKLFPEPSAENLGIIVSGAGATKKFSTLITDSIPDLNSLEASQVFPLYYYEEAKSNPGGLFEAETTSGLIKKDAIADSMKTQFQNIYKNSTISKQDIFYYTYGILHSLEYKERFGDNLKKSLPRIPFAKDFWAFSKAGSELAKWHLNYETIDPYPVVEKRSGDPARDPKSYYRVEKKMSFGKKDKVADKTTIVYNHNITLSGIPLQAYEYVVNGRSAIEWIIDRYQYSVNKDSKIVNDPNEYSDDPTYILNLLKRVVRVSVETVRIVGGLPELEELD